MTIRTGGKKMDNDKNQDYVDRDQLKFNKLLRTIFALIELSGFRLDSRISLTDLRTGKKYE